MVWFDASHTISIMIHTKTQKSWLTKATSNVKVTHAVWRRRLAWTAALAVLLSQCGCGSGPASPERSFVAKSFLKSGYADIQPSVSPMPVCLTVQFINSGGVLKPWYMEHHVRAPIKRFLKKSKVFSTVSDVDIPGAAHLNITIALSATGARGDTFEPLVYINPPSHSANTNHYVFSATFERPNSAAITKTYDQNTYLEWEHHVDHPGGLANDDKRKFWFWWDGYNAVIKQLTLDLLHDLQQEKAL